MPLTEALPHLRCPVCDGRFELDGQRVRCTAGHTFDVARQGYLNLAVGRAHAGTGDTTSMVLARERFLAAGHLRPVTDLIARLAARYAVPDPRRPVVDLAGGTGHHLAAVLDALPDRVGLCVDLSVPALRRAARCHPRAAAIGADAWRRLPIAAATAGLALSVFGPRDPGELERILTPGGAVLLVSPAPEHLAELVGPLGMVGVDPRKRERQAVAFARFRRLDAHEVSYLCRLSREDVIAAVAMGPTAAHVPAAALDARVRELPERSAVSVAVRVDVLSAGDG